MTAGEPPAEGAEPDSLIVGCDAETVRGADTGMEPPVGFNLIVGCALWGAALAEPSLIVGEEGFALLAFNLIVGCELREGTL